MTVKERYESAKEIYAKIGVDTDKAIETLKKAPVSWSCKNTRGIICRYGQSNEPDARNKEDQRSCKLCDL